MHTGSSLPRQLAHADVDLMADAQSIWNGANLSKFGDGISQWVWALRSCPGVILPCLVNGKGCYRKLSSWNPFLRKLVWNFQIQSWAFLRPVIWCEHLPGKWKSAPSRQNLLRVFVIALKSFSRCARVPTKATIVFVHGHSQRMRLAHHVWQHVFG